MKNNTIIILVAFICVIMAIFILSLRSHEHHSDYKKCDKKCRIENSICTLSKVPEFKDDFTIDSREVMQYYKLDDNCNFQTLAFNLNNRIFEVTKKDTVTIYPFAMLGRFRGWFENDDYYILEELETKVYSLRNPEDSSKLTRTRITGVTVDPNSNPLDVRFNLIFKDTIPLTPDNQVDYTYGLLTNETPVRIHKNASLTFEPVFIKNEQGTKPINGEYECNGKAITSN